MKAASKQTTVAQPFAAEPHLPPAPIDQLLELGRGPVVDVPLVGLHSLFEAQAERTPDAIALQTTNEPSAFSLQPSAFSLQMTYGELNQRANQLAHHLRSLGVGPEVVAGICLARGLELLVAILGVLKAGGAYLPLDPQYPPERLAFMLEDSRAKVLITTNNQRRTTNDQLAPSSLVVGRSSVVEVDLARDWPVIALEPDTTLESGVTPDNLAYVIYTSGSTGKPKGVMVTHRGVVNYLTWCRRAYPLSAGAGSPVHSSISFDLTVTSLFTPLLVGQPVQLLPEGNGIDPLGTASQAQGGYSLVKITPAHLELLVQQLTPQAAAGLTHAFVVGGESLLAEQIAFWQAQAPGTIVFNEYGPTETVVGCCVYQVPAGEPETGSVPIGRPIINTRLYLLDAQLRPVDFGAPGELYIGGAGVARGYLGRPDLTAERFVPNPFVKDEGGRMKDESGAFSLHPSSFRLYKTGDLARWRADGNLEFLGRSDHQVKLHGYRIELGEIEAALLRHPVVAQAAVVAREDTPGHQRLVAYIVPRGAAEPSHDELVAALEEWLPRYMVPRPIVFLRELPRTPNGKLDRAALPAPEPIAHAADLAPPRTALEQEIARAFAEALDTDAVGIHDNFFDLSGDSLTAVRLALRLLRTYNLDLSIVRLYQEPTVAGIACLIESYRREGFDSASMGSDQLDLESFLDPSIMPEWSQTGSAELG